VRRDGHVPTAGAGPAFVNYQRELFGNPHLSADTVVEWSGNPADHAVHRYTLRSDIIHGSARRLSKFRNELRACRGFRGYGYGYLRCLAGRTIVQSSASLHSSGGLE